MINTNRTLTTYDWFGYELPLKERYQLIREAGFDGVMLWWSDGFGRDALGKGDYRNGVQFARRAGLFIENIHAPCENPDDLWLDNLAGEALTDCYLQCITDCAVFDIPTMVVHLPEDKYPCNPLGLDRIKRITEKAERLCINTALENLHNLTNVAYVLNEIESNRIGFCYDSCHHFNYYPDKDLLNEYGHRLMALHLHDNGGSLKQHSLPFDGGIDWPIVMKKIAATGYQGATALEPMNWHYQEISIDKFLQKGFEMAKKLEMLRYNN